MSKHGYSGANYDKWVERTETSTMHKMKETFWTTKQAVIQKLGKKEDAHVVASDHELDSKLEVFRAIQKSSMELLRVIERYQDRLCALSQDENATGRFLKSQSNIDKTRAGKMMAAVGKSQSFAAQQRLALRVPLVRLYQEVETFRYRAISDTLMTINRMEGARTEYRGALLWMKNISEELDPDTYKQLEKFRKVQAQVRKTKAKFDKLKLDVMQKVDLLAASRCNMFSHVLANYQSTLLHFWEKTSRTMSAVAESFKGYQYYEFNIIKELAEPSKKLAEDTSRSEPAERDIDDDFDPSNFEDFKSEKDEKEESQESKNVSVEEDRKSVSTDNTDERDELLCSKCGQPLPPKLFVNLGSRPESTADLDDSYTRLIAFDEEESIDGEDTLQKNGSLQNLYTDEKEEGSKEEPKDRVKPEDDGTPSFMEFGEDSPAPQTAENFDFSGKTIPSSNKPKKNKKKGPTDLLSEELDLETDDSEKDDMTILNEILNAPSTGEDDFTKEWQAVFGNTPLSTGTTYTPVESDQQQSAEFMPSTLLDLNRQMAGVSLGQSVGPSGGVAGPAGAQPPGGSNVQSSAKQPKQKATSKKGQKDMSAWFSLFADLDPLSNPDAIGKTQEDMTDA